VNVDQSLNQEPVTVDIQLNPSLNVCFLMKADKRESLTRDRHAPLAFILKTRFLGEALYRDQGLTNFRVTSKLPWAVFCLYVSIRFVPPKFFMPNADK